MELETHGAPARGLRNYVHRVAKALGLGAGGYCIELESPVSAYLALDRRSPGFPDCDLALTWDEEHGWAAVIETNSPHRLVTLSYLGINVLPAPKTVAEFVDDVLAERFPGQLLAPNLRSHTDDDDLPARLAGYARLSVRSALL